MSRESSKEREAARGSPREDSGSSGSERRSASKGSVSPKKERREQRPRDEDHRPRDEDRRPRDDYRNPRDFDRRSRDHYRHPRDGDRHSRPDFDDRRPRRDDGPPSPSQEPGAETRTVYISQLDRKAKEKHLEEAFTRFGELVSAKIIKDPFTAESRGYGFLEFKTPETARAAIEAMNGVEFMGAKLRVEISKRAKPRGKTPGEYLGKRPAQDDYGYDRHRHARQGEAESQENGYARRPREFDERESRPRGYERRPGRYPSEREHRRGEDYAPRREHYSNDYTSSREQYSSRRIHGDRRGSDRGRGYNDYPRAQPHYRDKSHQNDRPRYQESASASPK